MSFRHMQNINLSEFLAGIVYIVIVIALCSIMALRSHHYKRIQYINSKELIRLSITDHLSGIYNRAKLDEELKRWINYSHRYSVPLSIIIFDFDDFKDVNDSYGHLVGDEVLIKAVSIINGIIRESDIFARWGGEEFVILLPNTDKANAMKLAERIRKSIEKGPFEKMSGITCSFGVAQLSSDDDVESLLHKVDEKLYLAKRAGKNVVKG